MPDKPQGSRGSPPYSLVFLAAGLYILIVSFKTLSPIILAFLLVVLLSIALNPLVSALRALIGDRTAAAALVLVFFLAIAGLSGWAFYTPIKKSTSQFFQRLPQYWERIQRPLLKLEEKAAVSEKRIKQEVRTEVVIEEAIRTNNSAAPVTLPEKTTTTEQDEPTPKGHPGMGQVMTNVGTAFKNFASNAATLLMVAITTFVGVIFTLLNPRPTVTLFFSFIPEQHHAKSLRVGRQIVEMLPRWALATLLGMLVIGLMVFLALWPLLGFQDALVLGLIAFVFEAVPFIGPLLAVVPAVLIAVGKGGLTPVWVLCIYAAIQMIENHFISPVIIGGRLKLQPVSVVFALLLAVAAFGVLGVLVAIPCLAIANILIDEIYRPRFLPNVSDDDLDSLAKKVLVNQFTLKRKAAEREERRQNAKNPPDSGS
jgi:predicted PurR-regulated permease PerM